MDVNVLVGEVVQELNQKNQRQVKEDVKDLVLHLVSLENKKKQIDREIENTKKQLKELKEAEVVTLEL